MGGESVPDLKMSDQSVTLIGPGILFRQKKISEQASLLLTLNYT